jgi:raffinose/stachyose/melibiose transport system substrate-binding protein
MKRRVLGAVAAVSVVALLAACSPSSSGSGGGNGNGKSVTLSVWSWRPEDSAAYGKIFSIFEKENPGIKVRFVPYKNTEYDTILKTGLSGAGGPDVAQLRSYGLLQPLVQAGDLEPLDGTVAALHSFPGAVLDGARSVQDRKVYGVPFAIQTLHVIYNKDIFSKYGLSVPTTWQDMIAEFGKLKAAGMTPLANTVSDTWMLPIEQEIFGAARYGGNALLTKMLSGQANFTDPNWVASVNTWLSTSAYWEPGYKGTGYADAQALFSSGKAAMFPGGIWEIAGFEKTDPSAHLGIFNVPPAPGAVTTKTLTPGYVDGSFGVSARSTHRDAALKLINWMAGPEFGHAFSDDLTQISAVPGVTPNNPLLAEAVRGYEQNPSPYVTYAYFSGGTPTAWDLAQKEFSNVILGKFDATQAAADINRGVGQWFKPQH